VNDLADQYHPREFPVRGDLHHARTRRLDRAPGSLNPRPLEGLYYAWTFSLRISEQPRWRERPGAWCRAGSASQAGRTPHSPEWAPRPHRLSPDWARAGRESGPAVPARHSRRLTLPETRRNLRPMRWRRRSSVRGG
jgi:hypothetical protein